MVENLKTVAEEGRIDGLYRLIKQEPGILDQSDAISFVDTPLHDAASFNRTHFALEIIRLKPSFGMKLNPDGLSPLHLALEKGHFETVRRLVKFDRELIRVKGKEGQTPLHLVAGVNTDDHINLLAEFLCACPESIEDLTIRDETALHIAVKRLNESALTVLLGCIVRTLNRQALNSKDEEGNTVLHAAVSASKPEVCLRYLFFGFCHSG